MLHDNAIWLGTSEEGAVSFLPQMANRHGLISGATGTGKTVTLQVLAEGFSQLGVPVFLADVKGDLAGLCKPGEQNAKITERLAACKVADYAPRACPVTFFDVYGEKGHPVRTTVSEMGPLLLARMLQLNETQSGVLHLLFRIADDEGLLLTDTKDLRAMLAYVGENASDYTLNYGNIAKSSIGAIQRALAILEDQGASRFFGEPALDIADWFVRDDSGCGMVNILAADKLFLRPAMYSAFMLWMLGEVYELLPEQGDSELPRMVFFFDEAHLLFEDCPKPLMDKIELIVRLVRSKGVGVFFITQNPQDIPSTVLSQLSGRVQHALRAFTPIEQRAVRAAAQTFRPNPKFDTETAITQLSTGEALLSFLTEDGSPSITQRATILPPQSAIGAISQDLRETFIETSAIAGKYDAPFDRESAYEVLAAKFKAISAAAKTTRVVQPVAEPQPMQAQAVQTQPAQAPLQTYAPTTFKVFDPATGTYVEREMGAMPAVQQPQYAQPAPVPAVQQPVMPAPVKQQKAVAEPKPKKQVKSTGQKLLDSFTGSIVRGAGGQIGRTVSRNILGIFGIK